MNLSTALIIGNQFIQIAQTAGVQRQIGRLSDSLDHAENRQERQKILKQMIFEWREYLEELDGLELQPADLFFFLSFTEFEIQRKGIEVAAFDELPDKEYVRSIFKFAESLKKRAVEGLTAEDQDKIRTVVRLNAAIPALRRAAVSQAMLPVLPKGGKPSVIRLLAVGGFLTFVLVGGTGDYLSSSSDIGQKFLGVVMCLILLGGIYGVLLWRFKKLLAFNQAPRKTQEIAKSMGATLNGTLTHDGATQIFLDAQEEVRAMGVPLPQDPKQYPNRLRSVQKEVQQIIDRYSLPAAVA